MLHKQLSETILVLVKGACGKKLRVERGDKFKHSCSDKLRGDFINCSSGKLSDEFIRRHEKQRNQNERVQLSKNNRKMNLRLKSKLQVRMLIP